ncbi:MAG: deoxynucleoside kinase [Bacteroidales bacterium]|jgi:deoxyadenosine/deoxycytidine kinase|nr:deoxynucleoside kinase [Bacteroidales bacterium]
MKDNYIVIEGTIGAGKTSLSTKIAEDFNANLILEQFADNSFLPKFYENPERYAFPLEMSFMADRFGQLKKDLTQTKLFSNFTISDYFIDKCLIFSSNNLKDDEFALYTKLFEIIASFIPKPDKIVYLYKDVDLLLENIKNRGRTYEQNISAEYLNNIQQAYMQYFSAMTDVPIIIVDTNKVDFIKNSSDYEYLISIIKEDYSNGLHRISREDKYENGLFSD